MSCSVSPVHQVGATTWRAPDGVDRARLTRVLHDGHDDRERDGHGDGGESAPRAYGQLGVEQAAPGAYCSRHGAAGLAGAGVAGGCTGVLDVALPIRITYQDGTSISSNRRGPTSRRAPCIVVFTRVPEHSAAMRPSSDRNSRKPMPRGPDRLCTPPDDGDGASTEASHVRRTAASLPWSSATMTPLPYPPFTESGPRAHLTRSGAARRRRP
ncbi:hypothetical protein B0H12DRAFT_1231050 [Mycena haematopus]|nr:hypothetical protein B0H12DRAFT_1231050 [Mycena haematopus]